MRINIAASHRFHLLDLARELSALGHDVRFYSYIPAWRCAVFGLDRWLCSPMLWLVWPFLLWEKVAPKEQRETIVWRRNILMDWWIAHTMRKCDVFIGLGSVYLKAFQRAKDDGAISVLEWGSKHIEEELRYMGRTDYPRHFLDRELSGYAAADYIAISSEHVRDSFLKQGIQAERLLINPYGVDLSQFHPTQCTGEFDLIMVGGWSHRKGCDLLIELCQHDGYRLLHVGPIVDLPFPESERMVHYDAVDQMELVDYYARARVFVLPSRTEGLALVQAQAVACGLPVVCSPETGGRDLRRELDDTPWIIEMRDFSLASLRQSVSQALSLADRQKGVRDYTGPMIARLSWKAYGERYAQNLSRIKK